MRMICVLASCLVLTLAAAGRAQAPAGAKLAAVMDCPKSDPTATADIGDAPGHGYALFKVKCTWSKGDIGGVKLQTDEDTFVSEMTGSTGRDSGYGVTTLAGGDKAFVRFQGTTTFKNNAPVSGQGTWTFTGGTGKAKGLKGKGTFKGTFKPDGSVSWQVDGEYTLAAAGGK